MNLITLTLQNFKKIKDFTLNAQGNNLLVSGPNGSGKTTLMDAYLWLLFDKDSTGRSPENKGFQLKTRSSDGEAISGLEHSVEGVFEHRGKTFALRKVFTEKGTAARGKAAKEFKGHETTCYIDGAPYSKTEYDAFIAALITEERFRLITDPAYFNRLDWQKRREIMLNLCSDITDADVFEANPDLAPVAELVEIHGTEKAKASLMDRRKRLNGDIEQIPVRIDEANKGLEAPAETVDVDDLKRQRAALEDQKKATVSHVQGAAKAASDAKQQVYTQINNITMQINKYRELRRDAEMEQQTIKAGLQRHETRIKQATEAIQDIELRMADYRQQHAAKEAEKTELIKAWQTAKARELPAIDTECPTCGQELPSDQLEAKAAEMAARFEAQKAKDMKAIEDKGASVNADIARINSRLADFEKHLADQRSVIEAAAQQLEAETVQTETPLPDYTKETALLEEQLAKLRARADEPVEAADTAHMDESLREIDEHIADIDRAIANQDVYAKAQARIKELKAQEKAFGIELAKVEGQIQMVERFITVKADMQEGAINRMFRNITFRLFDRQVNGGINPTFVTLIDGVAYPDANTASQINAGLEIIEYLCRQYDFRAPVFVDHKESVTDLYPVKSQVIGLEVGKDHKNLTVEVI